MMDGRSNDGTNWTDMNDSGSDSEPLLEFSVATKNRYTRQQWRESDEDDGWVRPKVRSQKKPRNNSASVQSFKGLSTDDKLVQIFDQLNRNYDKIQSLEDGQGKCMQDVRLVNKKLSSTNARVEQLEQAVKTLSYRSIDIEARSRRNNVIFYHITERSGLSDKQLVLGFIEDELGIDSSYMCIDRAHRLGAVRQEVRRTGSDPKRPLIVKFRDYVDTETVMGKAYVLKESSFGIDRDYPREIADARKQLYTSEEARRGRYERKNVQIRYPARLYIEGKLIDDKFPEWFHVMGQTRIGPQARRRQTGSRNLGESVSNPLPAVTDDLDSGESRRSHDSTMTSSSIMTSSMQAPRDVASNKVNKPSTGRKSQIPQRTTDYGPRTRSQTFSEIINSNNSAEIVSESQVVSSQVELARKERKKTKSIGGVTDGSQSNASKSKDRTESNGGVTHGSQSNASGTINTQSGAANESEK